MGKLEQLNKLSHLISQCDKCDLYKSRINAVPGIGHYNPRFLLVGEASGEEEDIEGIPFIGLSGQLLRKIIDHVGLEEKDYAITNIVKCRPPNNRDPNELEIQTCTRNWLTKQIHLLNPEVIISVGRISSAYFLGKEYKTGITKYAGAFFKFSDKVIYPIPHPSYFLRHGARGKEEMWRPYIKNLSNYLREK